MITTIGRVTRIDNQPTIIMRWAMGEWVIATKLAAELRHWADQLDPQEAWIPSDEAIETAFYRYCAVRHLRSAFTPEDMREGLREALKVGWAKDHEPPHECDWRWCVPTFDKCIADGHEGSRIRRVPRRSETEWPGA